jgi:hypothetical protein
LTWSHAALVLSIARYRRTASRFEPQQVAQDDVGLKFIGF